MTVPSKSNKPAAWATAWARQNPTYRGVLEVVTVVPKGKGGRRGWTRRTITFYVAAAGAAERRALRPKLASVYAPAFHNGPCEGCGELYRNLVLRRGWHEGQWLDACPRCHAAFGLKVTEDIARANLHSPLALHGEADLPVTRLDLTDPSGPHLSVTRTVSGTHSFIASR